MRRRPSWRDSTSGSRNHAVVSSDTECGSALRRRLRRLPAGVPAARICSNIVERGAAAIARRVEQAKQDMRGRHGVSAGAVPSVVLDSVIIALTASRFRRRSCGTSLRAMRTVQSDRPMSGRPRDALDFHRDEAPVEARVVRDEHVPLERAEQLVAHLGEPRRALAPSPT